MKRQWIVAVAIAVIGIVVVVLAKHTSGNNDTTGQSDLYKRCAEEKCVEAVFIKDMKVDLKTRLDVTVVKAMDSEGWQWMCREFRIPKVIAEDTIRSPRISYLAEPNHPETLRDRRSGGDCDMIVVVVEERMLVAYHSISSDEMESINIFAPQVTNQ